MFATIIQIKEIWFQVVSMQVQATRGTLLIVMIYFRDSGNFVRNQGVPPQSVALDLKKKLTRNDILSVRLFEFHCQSQSLDRP